MFFADSVILPVFVSALRRYLLAALFLAISMVPRHAFGADDWVMAFHDSRHTGQTSEVVSAPLTLAWTWVDTDPYDNSTRWNPSQRFWLPIYYKGKVCFQGGRNANRLICLNPADGTKLWEEDN